MTASPSLPPTPPPPPTISGSVPSTPPSGDSKSEIQPPKSSSGAGKIVKILLAVLVVLGLVGGAALAYFNFFANSDSSTTPRSGSGAPVKETTIAYWGLWEGESVYREVFDEFEAENPGVKIAYTMQSPTDYRERLLSELVRDQGPDIFRFHNTWTPMFRGRMDYLPSSVMTEDDYQNTFFPVIYEDLGSLEGIVGIPLMIDGLGLYYNKTMFATAGIQPPQTWDQLRQAAQQLTIKQGTAIERGGIALGTANNVDNYSDIIGLMLLQNNANPGNPTNSLAKDAIDYFLLFTKTDQVWDTALPPSTFAFANEKVAMMIGPSWRAHEIAAINPELEFAILPVPQLPSSDVSWASYWVEGVSQASPNKALAWKLLEFMSRPESLRKIYTAASNERLFGNPFPRIDMVDQVIGDPYVGAYVEQAVSAKSWPMAGRTLDNGINDRIIKYYEDAINAGATPASLETVANGVTRVLADYPTNPTR